MMAITTHTPRIRDDAVTLADWLEFEALTSANGVGALLELARQLGIGGSGDAEDEDAEEPRQFTDHPKLNEVMAELENRSAACGTAYPFEIDAGGNSITRRASWNTFTYSHLLLLSLIDCQKTVHAGADAFFPARLFEAICVTAAEQYLGGGAAGARAYHFGAPRPDGSGFSTALDSLARSMNGEKLGLIEPNAEKDNGLDVMAWRPFPDSRSNFVCLFGQCATGADWPVKNPEPKEFLNVWLRLETTAVSSVLFVPFTLNREDWVKKSQALVVFDRCRISSLLPAIGNDGVHQHLRSLAAALLAA